MAAAYRGLAGGLAVAAVLWFLTSDSPRTVSAEPAATAMPSATAPDARQSPVKPTPHVQPPSSVPAPPTADPTEPELPHAPPADEPAPSGDAAPAAPAGIPAGVTLTPHDGDLVVTEPGTVVDSLDISGQLEISANNVTVRNTLVRGGGDPDWVVDVEPGVTGVLVENSEVGGGADGQTQTNVSAGILLGNNTSPNGAATNVVRGVEIHHTIDGIRLDGNATVENSWIHSLSFTPGVHSDGIQSTGWSHMLVRGNTIEGGTNDSVFFKTEPSNPTISSVTVENNILIGVTDPGTGAVSSYGLGVADKAADFSAVGNTFRGPFQVAPASTGIPWKAWANNVLDGVGAIPPS